MASSSPDHVRNFRNRLPAVHRLPLRQNFDDLEQGIIEALDAADIAFQNHSGFGEAAPQVRFAQCIDYLCLGDTDNGWYR